MMLAYFINNGGYCGWIGNIFIENIDIHIDFFYRTQIVNHAFNGYIKNKHIITN